MNPRNSRVIFNRIIRVVLLVSPLTTLILVQGENQAFKCCYEGEQLGYDMKSCVPEEGSEISYDPIKTQNVTTANKFSWIPEIFKGSFITIHYGKLHRVNFDAIELYSLDTKKIIIEPGYKEYYVNNETFCADRSTRPSYPNVLLKLMQVLENNKCCQKYEQLNVHANACVIIPGTKHEQIKRDIVDYISFPTEKPWFGNTKLFFKINYNFLHHGYNFHKIFKYPSDLTKMQIGNSLFRKSTVEFNGKDQDGKFIKGVTDAFCFDSVSAGPMAPRVMLAAVYNIHKCCGKGEYIITSAGKCFSHPGSKVENVKNEFVNFTDEDDASWIPNNLRSSAMSVKYRALQDIHIEVKDGLLNSMFLGDNDIWTLRHEDNGTLTVHGNIALLNGINYTYSTKYFCFDTIQDNVNIIVLPEFTMLRYVRKCCFPGKVLSADGYCVKHDGEGWAPGLSEGRQNFDQQRTTMNSFLLPLEAMCYDFKFDTRTKLLPGSEKPKQVLRIPNDPWSKTVYCFDFQVSSGLKEEVVASCTFPRNAETYKAVRPLALLSATLLVAAAAVAMIREDTRRSAHGRALIAHAFCLAAANVIQATWFFTVKIFTYNCPKYSYPTYFFMIAANWWLTAITINMMKNFRRPLGAMARGAGGGTSPKAVWRRFGILSGFAWGGSVTITILVISVHQHRATVIKKGMTPPSFFETRTCGVAIRDIFRVKAQVSSDLYYLHHLGALYYYYIPVAILVAVNAVCMILTTRRVRQLGKESSFAHNNEKTLFQNVSLYVKLMLTTGIVELVMEAIAWAVGQYITIYQSDNMYSSVENTFKFGIFSTLLDLLRAIFVFWLCMGPWCNLGTGWNNLKAAVSSAWLHGSQWGRNL